MAEGSRGMGWGQKSPRADLQGWQRAPGMGWGQKAQGRPRMAEAPGMGGGGEREREKGLASSRPPLLELQGRPEGAAAWPALLVVASLGEREALNFLPFSK